MTKSKNLFKKIGGWFKSFGRWCKSLFVSIEGKEPRLKVFFKGSGHWFKSLFVATGGKEPRLRTLAKTDSFTAVLSSVVSILIGILFGAVLLFILKPESALWGLFSMLTKGFTSSATFAEVLYSSTPLIMTGLSIGFAFKTGLFNIGASGQYLMGGFFALYGGIVLQLPWWVCLLLAMAGGAIMGAIPGIFKALLNVNEVITCIMFNWIGLFAVNLAASNSKMLPVDFGGVQSDRTVKLLTVNPDAVIPRLGLDKLFGTSYMNIGIALAIIIAVIIYIVLNKTAFGYELKACGFNKNSAKYAGIKEKRSIILSMLIAGGLAGIGGGFYYLSGVSEYQIAKVLQAMGFNGIPVALLASSNPIGIIFSALFVSYIQVGGNAMQPEFAKEVIDIIIAVIIYLSAFALLFRNIIGKAIKNKMEERELKEALSAQQSMNAGDGGAGILPGKGEE